ncbi:FecR domain-containing protein [Porticoccus sp. W117]|uniref:FecR family protein n=1 Tax=Porticoccus sp. W117 TaxID=3054777 RepID=UPI002595DDE6|nr:FecR domain-containing protein [Porticoccus sp. W117]MDM3870462.1 FecR domain-containing protein [Porticoccus sp. W117]
MIARYEERRAAADAGLLLYGAPSDADLARMEKAKSESEEYAMYLQQFLDVSDALQSEELLLPQLDEGIKEDAQTARHVGRAAKGWLKYASVAAVLLVMVAVLQWPAGTGSDADMARYVTRIGEQKSVELKDGSLVTLNTGTELIAAMADDQRHITLNRGEAFFSVAEDSSRPFTVTVGGRSVTVLGTAFNVRKGNDGFVLAVSEGQVVVHSEYEPVSFKAEEMNLTVGEIATVSGMQQRRFKAGMAAEFNASEQQLIAYRPEDMKDLTNWQSGVLRFEGVPLSKVVKELNRYSAKKILVYDRELLAIEVFASVRVDDLSGALNVLDAAFPIDVIHQFDQIVLVSSKGDRASTRKNKKL